ncbi:MAG: hydrogenase iron-sulfur subunit, partial [Deltaproteobacteria bacterium]|nr:hydrogenase iron-sulfur subunit [Deltaproteobacteria bacterium]
MAGVSRLQYATDIRLVRVMCSGRVDLEFVLRAFSNGMDGVFIGGCRLNECNYITHGNFDALNMVLLCKKIMEHIGLNPERLRIEFMTSGEGNLFTEVVDEFSKTVKNLGPLGKGEEIDEDELKSKLEEIRRLVPYIKIEKRKKLASHLENKEEWEGFFTRDEIDTLLGEVVSYHIDPD